MKNKFYSNDELTFKAVNVKNKVEVHLAIEAFKKWMDFSPKEFHLAGYSIEGYPIAEFPLTADRAEKLKSRKHPLQRPVTWATVHSYAKQMSDDQFGKHYRSPGFINEKWEAFDIQHRCEAVIASGVAIPIRVDLFANDRIMKENDQTHSRNAADQIRVISASEFGKELATAAVTRRIINHENGACNASPKEVARMAEEHRKTIEAIRTTFGKFSESIPGMDVLSHHRSTALGVFSILYMKHNKKVLEFVKYVNGVTPSCGDHASKMVFKIKRESTKDEVEDTISYAFKCFLSGTKAHRVCNDHRAQGRKLLDSI